MRVCNVNMFATLEYHTFHSSSSLFACAFATYPMPVAVATAKRQTITMSRKTVVAEMNITSGKRFAPSA